MSIGWFGDSIELMDLSVPHRDYADELIDELLDRLPETREPTLIHYCGVPGSGKSTVAAARYPELSDYYLLQNDAVMVGLNEYSDLCAEVGKPKAYDRLVLPARTIGYLVLEALVRNRRSVLFDHGGNFPGHVDICRRSRDYGYWVELHHVTCPIETAIARVKKRNDDSERYFPPEEVPERAQIIEDLLPHYKLVVDRYVEIPSE